MRIIVGSIAERRLQKFHPGWRCYPKGRMKLLRSCSFCQCCNVTRPYAASRHNTDSSISSFYQLGQKLCSFGGNRFLAGGEYSLATHTDQLLQRFKWVAAMVESTVKCDFHGIGQLH